jgi:hypothetical protein
MARTQKALIEFLRQEKNLLRVVIFHLQVDTRGGGDNFLETIDGLITNLLKNEFKK